MVTGVPAGPDVGKMLTTLVSIAKNARASVLSPDLTDRVCMPPRSSGIMSGVFSRPPALTITFANSCSVGANPLPIQGFRNGEMGRESPVGADRRSSQHLRAIGGR